MRVAGDLFSFVARVAIGGIFIAHGLQKLLERGITGTAQDFAEIGLPSPTVAAWYATLVELIGGGLLILGLALPLVGILIAIDMAGALFLVHLPYGLFSPRGYELVLALGTAALALGFHGGRWSIDYGLLGRRRTDPGAPSGRHAG